MKPDSELPDLSPSELRAKGQTRCPHCHKRVATVILRLMRTFASSQVWTSCTQTACLKAAKAERDKVVALREKRVKP